MVYKSISLVLMSLFLTGQFFAQNSFPSSGDVGIGTTTPRQALDIKGVLRVEYGNNEQANGIGVDQNGRLVFYRNNPSMNLRTVIIDDETGNVGIGNIIPTEMLTVNGTAKAEEIIVEESVGADFVFNEDYELQSLSEVERYIISKKHLPEIPSAEEMIANGVKVGKLQMKLLQKIEELTLYVIELQKQVIDSKNDNNILLDKIKALEYQLRQIRENNYD